MKWNDELIKNFASYPRMIGCLVHLAAGGRGTGIPLIVLQITFIKQFIHVKANSYLVLASS